ncbi:MAG: DMT family transporter [Pseudomonadota bacterium]
MPRRFILGDVRKGGLLALAAAALFGLSTPAAKAITGTVAPVLLAGLLYLGSGLGLLIVRLARGDGGVPITRRDLPWLAGAVLFGGGLGPVLLMWGLMRVTGSAASLLLTLEGVFTALIAWIVFREPFNRRIGLGMVAIFIGAVTLGLSGPSGEAAALGVAAVAGACLCWAIDNNCTSRIAHVDAPTLAMIKGLVAGSVNVALGLALGNALPGIGAIAAAGIVGLLGYGVSLILFVLALREVGAARTGAYFSTAPFLGAVLGVVALHEPVTLTLIVAGLLMAFGVYLHLTEPAAKG